MKDLKDLIQSRHEAIRTVRETQDEDTRKRAWDAATDASDAVMAELVEREESRKADEERAAAEAREAAALKTGSGKADAFPVDELRNGSGKIALGRDIGSGVGPVMEYRADFTTTDTTTYSSYTVPQSWASSVINFAIAQSGLLQAGPTVITTTGGNQINMPALVTDATTAAGAEGIAATQSEVVFGTRLLNAYRFDGYFSVANELLDDTGVPLESLLRTYTGRSVAAKVNPYFTDPDIGTGSSTIQAIQVGNTSALTAASNASLTLEELKQLYYSVLPAYRANGKWVGNSALTLSLAQMRDDTGQFMWNPSLQAGEPDRFLGKPWFEDSYMDTFAAGNEPVIFGDIAAGYTIRYAHGGMQFIADKSFAVTSFETTFVWGIWVDAVVTDAIATKSITLP